jgi:hypothetical protein
MDGLVQRRGSPVRAEVEPQKVLFRSAHHRIAGEGRPRQGKLLLATLRPGRHSFVIQSVVSNSFNDRR